MSQNIKSKTTPGQQFETISPATKLLEKRRKMYEIHEAFSDQKVEFRKKEELFQIQEQDIKDKDMKIQMQLIEVCKYLQETEVKKTKAEKKYFDELNQKEKKDQEIINLKTQIGSLEQDQKKLEKRVGALKKYEEYLDNVMKTHSEQYGDLQDILTRYKTLNTSNENLKEEQKKLEEQITEIQNQDKIYKTKKQHEILHLQNENKNIQMKYETLRGQKQALESDVEDSNKSSSTKNLDLGRIFMAVDNLYNRCNEGMLQIKQKFEEKQNQNKIENKEQKGVKRDDKKQFNNKQEQNDDNDDNYDKKAKKAVEKLEKIKNHMQDFRQIIQQCKSDQTKEK